MKTRFVKALGLSLLVLLSSCEPKEKSPEERLSEIAEEKATLNGFILESLTDWTFVILRMETLSIIQILSMPSSMN